MTVTCLSGDAWAHVWVASDFDCSNTRLHHLRKPGCLPVQFMSATITAASRAINERTQSFVQLLGLK
jgi:hypothetical protein